MRCPFWGYKITGYNPQRFLDQLKFYIKCHKSKYFHAIFRLLKDYQDQNFLI